MSSTQPTKKYGFTVHEANVPALRNMEKEEIGRVGIFKWFLFSAQTQAAAEAEINFHKQRDIRFHQEDGSITIQKLNIKFQGDEIETRKNLEKQTQERTIKSREHQNAKAQQFGIALAQQPEDERKETIYGIRRGLFHEKKSRSKQVPIFDEADPKEGKNKRDRE